jgi:hypothetical protein
MPVVLHNGRRFELTAHPPTRHGDLEVSLDAPDGSSAGQAFVHLDAGHRAEVTVTVRPGSAAEEAGAVLLAEAAELAARGGAVELLAPHRIDDHHAHTMLEGLGLAYRDEEFEDEGDSVAVIDLRPLQEWSALAQTAA